MVRKKVGIALGGGGARGLAHIGVLKVLQENNIPIDYIAGTSMGAVIGAFYSAETNIKKVEKEILRIDWKNIFDYTIPTRGLIKGEKIEALLRKELGSLRFKDLSIPLLITSYDIKKNQEVVFSKGDLIKAIRASISIPGIFVPVSNHHKILIDGGIIDPVPTEILKGKVDIIIAVNVNKVRNKKVIMGETASRESVQDAMPGIVECSTRSLQVLSSEVSKADLIGDEIDFAIDIDLGNIGLLDFKSPEKIIRKGENTTKKLLEQIRSISEHHPFRDFFMSLQKGLEENVIGVGSIKKVMKK